MQEAGACIGAFEILSPLGAGGMGEVYRALDSRLEREVALKVLPATTEADDTARKRLLREARLASKLNHPHICTIYEVGEDDGQLFIAMELVSGDTLSARLSSGPVSIDEVFRLGRQMADALAHAHRNGLVHRDFKSGNVVITEEGRAKVLDFGLAARLSEHELSEATTYSVDSLELSGKIVGTLAYMAPEQLKGEGADARSDIWALGVVLYEMASGTRPFKGKTGFELSSEILSAAPEPLPPAADGTVPSHLQAVIDRCLEKEPSRRYQSAGEVREALESIGRPDQISPQHVGDRPFGDGDRARPIRMAVLPFVNFSGDPEQEILSDGFTQEMITKLGGLHPEGLSVIARTSVMRYKGGDSPIDQIGRELNVAYVLEGSVQREGDRIRIAADLIDVREQTQLWADSYERDFSGVLAVRAEVAKEVAAALALELLPAEQARLTAARPVNPEAYEAYLKGTHHWQKLTPEDLETAQRYFELALEKDPEYAPAYEGLAIVWGAREQMGLEEPQVAGPKSMEAALKAVELDPNSAQAHEALALAKTWREWDWAGAEEEWQRTLELNPNGANAHAYFAHYLAIVGRVDEAVRHSELAIELDPFNSLYHALFGATLIFAGRYREARSALESALEMQPDNPIALYTLAEAFFGGGLQEELVANQRLLISDYPELLDAFDSGLSAAGFQDAQRRVADLMAAQFESAEGNVPPWFGEIIIAWRYFFAGDFDRAVDWIEVAYELHNPNLPYLVAPIYKPLHNDPRFQDLLRRMNLPPELGAELPAKEDDVAPVRSPAETEKSSRRWLWAAAAITVVLIVLVMLDAGGVRGLLTGGVGDEVVPVRMAVLPFANLSGDPDQEYLSDGFTQEMITQLGKLHPEGLSVIARTSVMRYKGGDTPIDQIGQELGVDYVLEGSTQREGGRIRVAADLIHVVDQTQLWADSYERELSGILAVQGEVAQQVAEALALELLPAEQARITSARSVNPEAYEAYLKGTYYWKTLTPESLDTAQRYFELALEKDPTYASAYSGISFVWMARATATAAAALPHEAAPMARAAADRSLELDSTLAESRFALAAIATWYDWDWEPAEREFRLTLDLNPNFAEGHVFYGLFLTAMGRLEEARAHIQQGVDLDPHNFMYRTYLGIAFVRSRRFDEAIGHYQKALAMEPTFRDALGGLANAYHLNGMYEESLEIASGAYRARGEHDIAEALDRGNSLGGYREARRQAAEAMVAHSNPGNAMRIAALFTYAGDTGRALDWLETAYRERLQNMIYLGVHPKWDPLRSDPRFQDLLRRMNLPATAF